VSAEPAKSGKGTASVMRAISVEKVTLNMGTGKETPRMEKAIKLLTAMTERKPVKAVTNKRIPTWGVRPGLPLGVKVTIRREAAVEVLKRLLAAKDNRLKPSSFGTNGELAFGIPEYIDILGIKYDPTIGVMGLDVCVTLKRPGFRVKRRRRMSRKVPSKHTIGREDAMAFMRSQFGIEVTEE